VRDPPHELEGVLEALKKKASEIVLQDGVRAELEQPSSKDPQDLTAKRA